MREDDRIEDIGRDSPVFSVAPVRSRTRASRAVLLALTVGIAAFVAGIGVRRPARANGPRPVNADPAGSPARSPTTATGELTPGTPTATPTSADAASPASERPSPR